MKLNIISIGNSVGVVLPKELLARLQVGKGDALFVTEGPDGIKLMPHDPSFEEKMQVVERIMRQDRAVLRKLADS